MNAAMGNYHILLVEDDLADAGLVRIALRKGRHPVTLHHAKDYTEAFGFLRRIGGAFEDAPRPHLIFLDLNLPGRSGHEILQEIKGDPNLCGIPVIILSTSEAERDVVRSYHLGANSFVSKPMDADDFTHHIHTMEAYWFDVVRLPAGP